MMTSQVHLSAFGDEIADSLSAQLKTLNDLHIGFLELRGVWGKNVLELDDHEVKRVEEQCRSAGVVVSAIGSPIGKSLIEAPEELDLENLSRAFEIAAALGVTMIRVFSFYPPEGTQADAYDAYVPESARRLANMAERAAGAGMMLVLENEKDIVGDSIARCHALLSRVSHPNLRFAWDPANFVQVGEDAPTADGWPLLGEYVAHVHIKDALSGGDVTPAGDGNGEVGLLLDRLREAGYTGYLALEPHLAIAGHSSGFSGVGGMGRAVAVLRQLMSEHNLPET